MGGCIEGALRLGVVICAMKLYGMVFPLTTPRLGDMVLVRLGDIVSVLRLGDMVSVLRLGDMVLVPRLGAMVFVIK